MYIHIYIYIDNIQIDSYPYTHIYIYIYICVYIQIDRWSGVRGLVAGDDRQGQAHLHRAERHTGGARREEHYTYIYIYIERERYTHIHTIIYIYIYMLIHNIYTYNIPAGGPFLQPIAV